MVNGLSPVPPEAGVRPITIEEEMRRSYLDYAMSVIVSRALPDARDGLKPVQRRILYAMQSGGYVWNRPYRKSARIVGEVMGKYHPHGDQAIYDALARMTQPFSMRLMLLDGQGNFGSMDGDPPAAMRYTETRLARLAHAMLEDIDRDTVDFQDNYDGSEREPSVLPSAFPNLLINGAGGIAVGMATNIPPHNPGEVMEACLALIDDPGLDIHALMEIVKGPDFPTGGLILGRSGSRAAYETGRGQVLVRAQVRIEESARGRKSIVATELPYQVNKAALMEKIALLVREKRVEGIAALRDETDRDGVRVVIEVKREADPHIVLNQLYRHTALQSAFSAQMLALDGGRPKIMTLREMLQAFLDFREEVVGRRSRFALARARARAHLLAGLAIAVDHIDAVIAIIRKAKDTAAAMEALRARKWPAQGSRAILELIADPRHQVDEEGNYALSQEQVRAILDLRLQRLTGLGREEIAEEMKTLSVRIREYLGILGDRKKLLDVVRGELQEARKLAVSPRRSEIGEHAADLDDESLIQSEEMLVTVSRSGYVKRVPLSLYRSQRRGGKGRAAMTFRDSDYATTLFSSNTHDLILFFSSRGRVYQTKTWQLPQGSPQTRGKALVNFLPLAEGEAISLVMRLPPDKALWEELQVMFATRKGKVRRNRLSDFARINRGGKIAMKLDSGDAILGVAVCREGEEDIMLTTRKGMCIRFPVGDVRVFSGRTSSGVRGVRLGKGDEVIAMSVLLHTEATADERTAYLRASASGKKKKFADLYAKEQFMLTLSSEGYGKRTSSHDYRRTARGGKGIAAMALGLKNESIAAAFPVKDSDQIMLITESGKAIRCPVKGIRKAGRKTQGVRIFSTDDKVAAADCLREEIADSANGGEKE